MGSSSGSFGSISFTNSKATTGTWRGTFDYSGSGASVDFRMIGESNTTVYKGTGPRSGSGSQGYYVARRTASVGDEIVYRATHEAYTSSARISSIEKLAFDGDDGTAIGIKVTLDGGIVDYIVHTLDSAPFTSHTVTGESNFVVKGKFAHVRVTSGTVTWMYLIDGSYLSFGSAPVINGTYSYSGTLTETQRTANGDAQDAFVADQNLPSDVLDGKTLIVEWNNGWKWGYEIDSVVQNKIVSADEPAFDYSGSNIEMQYFPIPEYLGLTHYEGPATYYIPGSAVYYESEMMTTQQVAEVYNGVSSFGVTYGGN
jgi:hypothetical protein